MSADYEALADRAELAAEELDVRQGRAEADHRPLIDATNEELEQWAHWDPEQDPDIIEDLGGGMKLRRIKPRSTAKRRLRAEPEGEMPPEPEAKGPEPAPKAPAAKRTPRAPAPQRRSARIPLGAGLSQLIGALGLGLIVTGRDPGVGMALQFEAPIAGDKLDSAIEGTPVDRVLQPFARAGAAGKELGAVLALPFLVGLIERRPELYPVLKDLLLRPLVTDLVVQLGEAEQRQAERVRKALAGTSAPPGKIDEWMGVLFEGRPPEMPQPPDAPAGD